jgi:hypothetical protein
MIIIHLIESSTKFLLNEQTEDGHDPLDLSIKFSQSFECIQVLVEAGHPIRRKHLNSAHEMG